MKMQLSIIPVSVNDKKREFIPSKLSIEYMIYIIDQATKYLGVDAKIVHIERYYNPNEDIRKKMLQDVIDKYKNDTNTIICMASYSESFDKLLKIVEYSEDKTTYVLRSDKLTSDLKKEGRLLKKLGFKDMNRHVQFAETDAYIYSTYLGTKVLEALDDMAFSSEGDFE